MGCQNVTVVVLRLSRTHFANFETSVPKDKTNMSQITVQRLELKIITRNQYQYWQPQHHIQNTQDLPFLRAEDGRGIAVGWGGCSLT